MTTCNRVFAVLSLAGLAAAATACSGVVTRINPEQVANGKSATVVVKLAGGAPLPNDVTPALQIVDGEECGSVTPATQKKDDGRWASGTFTANNDVENCAVTIRATVGAQSATTRAMVNRFDPRVRIDGVSAIAAILIASFAIDRVTTGILAGIAFLRGRRPQWFSRRTRDFADIVAADRNERVPYFVIAGVLGAVVLGWFGDVRVLAALGFASVNPYLDALITGLVLMIGADRASDLLEKLDVPGASSARKPSAPIEVTGKLVLENPEPHAGAGDPMRMA